MADINGALGRYRISEGLYEECAESYKRVLGPDHPDTLSAMGQLAGAYSKLGCYDKAKTIYVSCYDFSVVRLGEEHPTTVSAKGNLAALVVKFSLAEQTL